MTGSVIVRNSIRCLVCTEEIESAHVHDFRRCGCGSVAVDGGLEYLRRMGDSWEGTSIVALDEPREHPLEHSDQILYGVHHSALCAGRPCTVHNRSDHHLRGWPQVWDGEGHRVMRECPHGVMHRDPDQPGRRRCIRCDGCCRLGSRYLQLTLDLGL